MRFDSSLPLSKANTPPSQWYVCGDHFKREMKSVFRRSWQVVARSNEVQEPGSFVTGSLGNENIIVLRDRGSELRCISNICRHRGTEILKQASGKIPCLNCRYHGWTYDLDGSLRKAPQFEGVENFNTQDFSLPQFSVGVWGPYVFAALAPEITLEETVRDLSQVLSTRSMTDFRFTKRVNYDLNCNWKVYVDNYLDGGYHVPSLHKALASVLDDSEYKIEIFERTVWQSAPILPTIQGTVGQVRKGSLAHYGWIYPNIMLNFYEGVFDVNLVIPTGPESCRVVFDYFFETPTDPAWVEQSISVAHQVQIEDIEVSESVQRGLRSFSYENGRYSMRREAGDYLFHRLLDRDLRASE